MKTRIALIGLAALLAVGCAPSIKLKVLEPAPVNFGAARRLSFVQGEGNRSARDWMLAELASQVHKAGYFTFADRSGEGFSVAIAGPQVQLYGGRAPQGPDEILLRVDVLQWTAYPEQRTENHTDGKGNAYTTTEMVLTGRVVLGATAVSPQGAAMLAQQQYVGSRSKAGMGVRAEVMLEEAGRAAVAELLRSITPRTVQKSLRLDEDDDAQKPMLELAKAGEIVKATEQLRAYLASHPDSPEANYNLGVFLDVQGRFGEAIDLYTKADELAAKDYYLKAKADCEKRLADVQALSR